MAEIKKELTSSGKITCNRNILLSIINLATKEISGVAGLSNRFKNPFTRMFTKKDFDGVKLKFNPNGLLVIDVYINVYNNCNVPDIAYRVQENIKNNIASMVEMKTAKVNVHIVDVVFQKDEASGSSL